MRAPATRLITATLLAATTMRMTPSAAASGAHAGRGLFHGGMDEQERGVRAPHRVRQSPDREDQRDDDPETGERPVDEGQLEMERAVVRDADRGPRDRQDQGVEAVERVAAGQARAR